MEQAEVMTPRILTFKEAIEPAFDDKVEEDLNRYLNVKGILYQMKTRDFPDELHASLIKKYQNDTFASRCKKVIYGLALNREIEPRHPVDVYKYTLRKDQKIDNFPLIDLYLSIEEWMFTKMQEHQTRYKEVYDELNIRKYELSIATLDDIPKHTTRLKVLDKLIRIPPYRIQDGNIFNDHEGLHKAIGTRVKEFVGYYRNVIQTLEESVHDGSIPRNNLTSFFTCKGEKTYTNPPSVLTDFLVAYKQEDAANNVIKTCNIYRIGRVSEGEELTKYNLQNYEYHIFDKDVTNFPFIKLYCKVVNTLYAEYNKYNTKNIELHSLLKEKLQLNEYLKKLFEIPANDKKLLEIFVTLPEVSECRHIQHDNIISVSDHILYLCEALEIYKKEFKEMARWEYKAKDDERPSLCIITLLIIAIVILIVAPMLMYIRFENTGIKIMKGTAYIIIPAQLTIIVGIVGGLMKALRYRIKFMAINYKNLNIPFDRPTLCCMACAGYYDEVEDIESRKNLYPINKCPCPNCVKVIKYIVRCKAD